MSKPGSPPLPTSTSQISLGQGSYLYNIFVKYRGTDAGAAHDPSWFLSVANTFTADDKKYAASYLLAKGWGTGKTDSDVIKNGLGASLRGARDSGAKNLYDYVEVQGATSGNTNHGTQKTKPTIITNPNVPTGPSPTNNQTLSDPTATAEYSAMQQAENVITQVWGLDPSSPLSQKIVDLAHSGMTDQNQILATLRNTDEYKQAFPGIEDARKIDNNFSERNYVDTKAAYLNTARNVGLPAGFMTTEEVGKLIGGGVSSSEFDARVIKGYEAVRQADPIVKKQFQDWYGVGHGQLLAYFLDPKKGSMMVQKQASASQIGGEAQQVGLGAINQAGGQQLAAKTVGVGNLPAEYSGREIKSTLETAAKNVPLERTAVGQDQPTANQAELIGSQIAGYGGTKMASAQKAVQKASQARLAPFQKGGGYGETNKGVTGLGSAPQ